MTAATSPVHHLLDVYGVHLHLATTRRAWATLRRRYPGMVTNVPDSLGWCRMSTYHPPAKRPAELHIVLWVNLDLHADTDPGELVDTLAHEATHAALGLMDHIGSRPDGTDEPVAYLIGWITSWMWRHIDTSRAE